MPGITYIIRFTHRGSGFPYEEQEHISLADAWNAFRLFAEPDSADLYSEIELAEHNWEEDTERSLARLTPVSYTHLDVYKRQDYIPLNTIRWLSYCALLALAGR